MKETGKLENLEIDGNWIWKCMLKNCGVRVWSRTGANIGYILNTTLRVRDSWQAGNFISRKPVNFPRTTFRWRNWLAVETEWQNGSLAVHKSPATAGNKLLSLCPGCKYTLVHACSNRWLHPEKYVSVVHWLGYVKYLRHSISQNSAQIDRKGNMRNNC
jgi:hypothetical protein